MSTKEQSNHLLSATRGLLLLLMFLLPLFFLPVTIEPLEFHKQTLLLVLTFAAALCWLGASLTSRTVTLRAGWVNTLPLALLGAFLVPALFSVAPYLSWVGAQRQEYTSVLTMGAAAVLFYLLANTMRGRSEHRAVHLVLLLSTAIVAVTTILEVLGVPVASRFAPSLTLNPIGTLTSLAAWLVVMSSFFLAVFVAHQKKDTLLHEGWLQVVEVALMYAVLVGTALVLLLLDDSSLWALMALAVGLLFVFVLFRANDFPRRPLLLVPLAMLILSLAFWFVLPGLSGPSLPLEVTPSAATSQMIAEQTLQAHSSSWGSGPGTYAFDFARFRPAALNQTDFWNVRFDRASSFLLTLVPTIGMFGVTLLGLFVLLLLMQALVQVLRPGGREQWLESFAHLVPWLVLLASATMVAWNMTLVASFGVFSGLLASQIMNRDWTKTWHRAPAAKLVFSFVFVVLSLGFLVGIFVTASRYAAEVAFSRAVMLDRKGGELQEVVSLLDRASTLNAHHDTYYRNLAEALLLRVEAQLSGVNSIDTLTPESTQYVQALIAASVNAAARATELSAHQALNWVSRGMLYRELMPVMGEAGAFAVSSYERAVELEPAHPGHWTALGVVYLAVAEQARPLTASPDAAAAAQATAQLDQSLSRAQAALDRAVELKPNYAPAHYQLAVVYQRQGRMNDAIGKMESVAQYNQLDVGVFFQLGMMYLSRDGAGDRDRAKEALSRAVELEPAYANAHWFLATLYEQEGDLAAAVREVEAVLKLNPDNEIVQSRLERLLVGQISTEVPEAIEE